MRLQPHDLRRDPPALAPLPVQHLAVRQEWAGEPRGRDYPRLPEITRDYRNGLTSRVASRVAEVHPHSKPRCRAAPARARPARAISGNLGYSRVISLLHVLAQRGQSRVISGHLG